MDNKFLENNNNICFVINETHIVISNQSKIKLKRIAGVQLNSYKTGVEFKQNNLFNKNQFWSYRMLNERRGFSNIFELINFFFAKIFYNSIKRCVKVMSTFYNLQPSTFDDGSPLLRAFFSSSFESQTRDKNGSDDDDGDDTVKSV